MKRIIFISVTVFSICINSNAQNFTNGSRESMRFPKDSALLNIKDSILIGKDFVAVKGFFFSQSVNLESNNTNIYVKGYKDKKEIKLIDLRGAIEILSDNPAYKVAFGQVAYLKPKNAAASIDYFTNFNSSVKLQHFDLLEPGDIIVFYGLQSFNGKKATLFHTKWYTIVK
jgi:hypothetical protein